jgi:autotransporter-associated beta strand protein
MRHNLAEARTITATDFTITTGAVLVGSTGTSATGLTINGGTLRSAATVANKDLVLINTDDSYLTINSTIDNAAIGNTGLTKSGTGLVTLGGSNTYTGPTFVNQGTLRLGHSSDTLDGDIVVRGGTLVVDNPDTVGAVTLVSGTISGDSALTGTSYAVESGTVSTDLAGSGVALTKATGGKVTLSGTNTYTGATLVSAGTLLVNGSLGNTAVTVSSGATIGGSGSLGGSLGLDAGALLDVTGATLGLTSTGILTAISTITLTNFGLSSIIGWDYTTAANGTYTLINGGSSITLAGTTPTISNPFDLGGGRQGYFQAGSLQAVIIPEPRAALIGSIGMLMLLRRRRA